MAQVATIGKQLDAAFPIGLDLDTRFRSPYGIARPWGVRTMSSRPMGVPAPLMRLAVGTTIGAVVLVLLVACTNLANLMLARNLRRRGEMGTRVALGASRGQLVLESMAEPLMLTIAGGVAGMGVARVLMKVLSTEVAVGNGFSLQVLPRLDPAHPGRRLLRNAPRPPRRGRRARAAVHARRSPDRCSRPMAAGRWPAGAAGAT